MFYDIKNEFGGRGITQEEYIKADDDRVVVEIWNDVFMQYEKKDGKIIGKLPKPSVDTGAGLERLAMTLQGVDNIYDTDLLKPVMDKIKELSKNWDIVSARILADHVRSSVHLIADGVVSSNTGRGYILRRLLRRAMGKASDLQFEQHSIAEIIPSVIAIYRSIYNEIEMHIKKIEEIIRLEEQSFLKTMVSGRKELLKMVLDVAEKGQAITGQRLFSVFETHGFPLEAAFDEIDNVILKKLQLGNLDTKKYNKKEIKEAFEAEFKKHQSLSRAGAEQKFKGGLGDANDPMVVRYHTATHLLHQALHDVLGENEGNQKGSNITAERLRFDFTGVKLTDEQKKRVEDIVNEKIAAALPMNNVVLPRAEAEKTGARHFFGEKYGDEISIYYIGDNLETAYSKEFCGGPHVKNTKELAGPEGKWKFKIQKEEASSQGVRRIKAVLE
jgi:alanyl-tRNA synthetase